MAATTNAVVSAAWSVLATADQDFLLTRPFPNRYAIEVAITDSAGTPPTIVGHVLNGDQPEGLNRALLGPGVVWARSRGESVAVVLTAWPA